MRQKVLSSTGKKIWSHLGKFIRKLPGGFLLLVSSPVLFLGALFSPRFSRRILYAYLLFSLLISSLAVAAYCQSIREVKNLETVLGEFFHPAETNLNVPGEVRDIVYKYAVRFDINPHLVLAVIQVESSFNPNARSPKGACGLMQITPLVWQYYNPGSVCNGRHLPGTEAHGDDCVYAVEANIRTGVHCLRDLIDYYQGETGPAVEAYNAGLTNVDRERIRPKYQETRNYLQRIGTLLAPAAHDLTVQKLHKTLGARSIFQGLAGFTVFLWALLAVWVLKRFPEPPKAKPKKGKKSGRS